MRYNSSYPQTAEKQSPLIFLLRLDSENMIDSVRITPSPIIPPNRFRIDLQHHLFTMSLDGALGLAPSNTKGSKLNRVLDVGTGTGIWAIDFGRFPEHSSLVWLIQNEADEHPEAEVQLPTC